MTKIQSSIPAEFQSHELLPESEKFLTMLGPWYFKQVEHANGFSERVFGVPIEDKHTNIWGSAHGGMLISMADSALGYNLARCANPPQNLVTVHLDADFVASPKPGDWIHSEFILTKAGSRISFAQCNLWVGTRLILKTNGVFTALKNLRDVGKT